MNIYHPSNKDLSKAFTFIRAQLYAKEKELFELQRSDPYLLPPDFTQIDTLVDAIAALQLSTQDGSFVFASTDDVNEPQPNRTLCSTGFDEIKAIPLSQWISPTTNGTEQKVKKSTLFDHLLSLPISAYLRSSHDVNNSFKCIPMANHILFMPISAFKPSSNRNTKNNHLTSNGTFNSLLDNGMPFSKQQWIKNENMSELKTV